MSLGSLMGRILLAVAIVAVLLAMDVVLPWARQKLRRCLESEETAEDVSNGIVAPAVASSSGDEDKASETAPAVAPKAPDKQPAVHRTDDSVSATEAQKAWVAAREMPHHFIPDWDRDADYLTLLHEAAVGGSMEAMNKLADYAFRRRAFVEAYYWKLKIEMGKGPVYDFTSNDVLAAWVACNCPKQYRNVMRGFSEEQGMFARAVMRLKVGIDMGNAGRRLKKLAKEGNPDAQQYLRRTGENKERKS